MSKLSKLGSLAVVLAFAGPALAQPLAGPDAPMTVVPLAQRLSVIDVFTNAKPVVQLVLAGLVVAIVYAAFAYGRGLIVRRYTPGGGSTFLCAMAGGGPLIGLFGASYDMLDSFIGMANVRPAPSLSILAPGLAEAALCLTLGLLAGAVATIGSRHLTGRAQTAGLAAEGPPAHLARAIG